MKNFRHPGDIRRFARGRHLTRAQANALLLALVPFVFRPGYEHQVEAARVAVLSSAARRLN